MHKLFVKPVSFEELAGRVEERKRPYSHKLAEILNSVPPSPGLGLPWWGGGGGSCSPSPDKRHLRGAPPAWQALYTPLLPAVPGGNVTVYKVYTPRDLRRGLELAENT